MLEARAHANHDVLVYIPEHQMICMGDVTFPLFPTWADSSRERILDCLTKALAMTRNGHVAILADGHGDRCYQGRAEIEQQLEQVITDHQAFERALVEILEADDELTPAQVYQALRSRADDPVLQRHLKMEFPATPASLQNIIVSTLLQLGYQARGPRRHQRFYRPVES